VKVFASEAFEVLEFENLNTKIFISLLEGYVAISDTQTQPHSRSTQGLELDS
jgi:hypothetical protein